jgi:hypothetical protein
MRVPDTALKNVVYLGSGDSSSSFHAIGTGFLVDHNRIPGGVSYLVTADHVARKLKPRFAIRFNDKQGKSHVQQSQKYYRWWRHPTDKSVDAAVFPWGLKGGFSSLPIHRVLTDTTRELTRIGIGDEIFIVGLFRKWAGRNQMVPIVRHGHIAMIASEPIPTKNYGDALMHLVEAFSLAGMSGSPVLARQTRPIPLVSQNAFEADTGMVLGDIYLLGLVHGIFPTEVAYEVRDADPGQVWHSGISMVVPSTKILEILNQPKLIEYEKKVFETVEKEKNKPIETAIAEPADGNLHPKLKRKNRDIPIAPISREKFFGHLKKATKRGKR